MRHLNDNEPALKRLPYMHLPNAWEQIGGEHVRAPALARTLPTIRTWEGNSISSVLRETTYKTYLTDSLSKKGKNANARLIVLLSLWRFIRICNSKLMFLIFTLSFKLFEVFERSVYKKNFLYNFLKFKFRRIDKIIIVWFYFISFNDTAFEIFNSLFLFLVWSLIVHTITNKLNISNLYRFY